MKPDLRGPIFVMGFPRSGTTGFAHGLAKISSFPAYSTEGHFVYLFDRAIQLIVNNSLNPNCIARNEGAKAEFFESMADSIDKIFRHANDAAPRQWVDKTPDIAQVRAIPSILALFPDAWFIYLYRDPVSCVRSNLATWPAQLEGMTSEVSQRWLSCQQEWRSQREKIAPQKRIEIHQTELLKNPAAVVEKLGQLFTLSADDLNRMSGFWDKNRAVNRPREGQRQVQYDKFDLSMEQVEEVSRICAAEVAEWNKIFAPKT